MEILASWPVGAGLFFVLVLVGLPISIALTAIGLLGTAAIIGWTPALSLLSTTFFEQGRNYSLSVLPLFLIMGNFVVQSASPVTSMPPPMPGCAM